MSTKPGAKRRAMARALAAMERQAGRSKTYIIELFSGSNGLELLARAAEGNAEAAERLRIIGRILSG